MTATDTPSQPSDDDAGDPVGLQSEVDIDLSFPWRTAPDRSLDDVGGLDQLKRELRRTAVRPLGPKRSEYRRFNVDVPNLLFAGPPGTGKSHSATALAGELGYPYVVVTCGRLQSRWLNESTDRVQQLFREAAHIGQRYGHAVILAEEIDTLLPARGGTEQHQEDNKVTSEFLAYLERTTENETLFVGTTNRRDELDPAAVRSGRIDREFQFAMPSEETRAAILKQQLANRPSKVPAEDVSRIATETEGVSAAALTTLVTEAARYAVEQGDSEIRSKHLATAVSEHLNDTNSTFRASQPVTICPDRR
ncbi:AAA family ATPase [Halorientalis marina]|uniref:AAA family ATPase n=1 Tax=Halorientalis marina TaxID=2931976 RepID=UPI001FF42B8C|nr:ATP-binding protein [Halorientalis marina]